MFEKCSERRSDPELFLMDVHERELSIPAVRFTMLSNILIQRHFLLNPIVVGQLHADSNLLSSNQNQTRLFFHQFHLKAGRNQKRNL